jgi:predicted AlkP superfamily pyrophosphatase or phosphodiesterase
MVTDEPVLPDWADRCVTKLVPALVGLEDLPSVAPDSLGDASAVVLVVIDGLGWHQLQQFASVAPTLSMLDGGPITTVAPSTTSAALTSITTGTAPGEHGIVGYRIDVDGENLNCLSWRTPSGDARERIPPESFQAIEPFCGERPVVVQNAPFQKTGFTRAHLRGTRQQNWRTLPTLPVEVRRAVAAGEPLVYAYYDGIDKIAHEFGFGEHYEAELATVDRMIGDLMMMLPRGVAVVVTADHGLVDCTDGRTELHGDVWALTNRSSGEARFRWLHAEPGRARDLLDAARHHHADRAWVVSAEQAIDERWFGRVVSEAARARLGDVAVAARDHWFFTDRADATPDWLIGRHGSLSEAEMRVPMLCHWS